VTTIITREGAKFWWKQTLPKEVAYLVKDSLDEKFRKVTYREILDKKIEKQRYELQWKRLPYSTTKPCFVWVFFNPGCFYGGWWLYVKTLNKNYDINFRNPQKKILIKIMELFPCGFLPIKENFEKWAPAFAKLYSHIGFKRTKQGIKRCYCQINHRDELVDIFFKDNGMGVRYEQN